MLISTYHVEGIEVEHHPGYVTRKMAGCPQSCGANRPRTKKGGENAKANAAWLGNPYAVPGFILESSSAGSGCAYPWDRDRPVWSGCSWRGGEGHQYADPGIRRG